MMKINQFFGCKNKATITDKKNIIKNFDSRITNQINQQITNLSNNFVKIDDLQKTVDDYLNKKFADSGKQPPNKRDNCFCRIFKNHWFLIGIIIILLGAIVFFHFQTIADPNDVTLILSFVGILATFVVVSNYIQVKEIKDEFISYKNETDKLKENMIHISVGLNIIYANNRLHDKPIESLFYYLNAIDEGLDSLVEIDDIYFCMEQIKSINNININNETLDYKSFLSKSRTYHLRADGITIDDFIEKIQSHKNYKVIKQNFEQLINNK